MKNTLDRRYVTRGEFALANNSTTEATLSAAEATRLANETARSVEENLKMEMLLWQAIDAIEIARTGAPYQGQRTTRDDASQVSTTDSSASDM